MSSFTPHADPDPNARPTHPDVPAAEPQPQVGTSVRYVLSEGAHSGEARDATITDLFGTHMRLEVATETGDGLPSPLLVFLAPYDADKKPGTWH